MALNIPNFNRIIDLKFLIQIAGPRARNQAMLPYVELPQLSITCPRRGRKPAIEITGTFTTGDSLPAFNIAIKNLYMSIPNTQYPKIKVTAGYENNLQTFEGTILTMYQEQPGPEGRTIIQCVSGTTATWLDTILDLQYEADSFSLLAVLQKIATTLNMKLRTSEIVKTLISKSSLQFQGRAQDAISKLKSMFSAEGLVITVQSNEIRAYTMQDKIGINIVRLAYLSTPPQQNAGSDGIAYSTLVAPWNPTLRPGDKVIYNTWQFMKNFSVSNQNVGSIIVDNIQFQFGTVGSVNQMTIQGHAV